MRKTAILLALACAFARADYGPGTTDSDLLRSGTPVVTNAWLAVSNETVRIARSVAGDAGAITDGTNRIDATRDVWRMFSGRVCTNASEVWTYSVGGATYTAEQMTDAVGGGDHSYSQTLVWMNSSFIGKDGEEEQFEGWFVNDGTGSRPVGYSYITGETPESSADHFLALAEYDGLDYAGWTNVSITAFRGTFVSGANYVGRLALTNDIPSVVDADLTPATNYANTVARSATNYANSAVASLAQTGTVWRALSVGTTNYWQDATGCVWSVGNAYSDWHVSTNGVPFKTLRWNGGAWTDENSSLEYQDTYWFFTGSWIDSSYIGPESLLTFSVDAYIDSYGEFVEAHVTFARDSIYFLQTNIIGRVALTNDIPDVSGYATQQQATNAAVVVVDAKISTNNEAFVSAVLAAPLAGADAGDLAELSEYGSYGTVGAAILALIAGLAALKRRIATAETAVSENATAVASVRADLPYALVTPGEWEFSGLPNGVTVVNFEPDGSGKWYLSLSDGDYGIVEAGENILSVEIVTNNGVAITATRPALPGHLLDRAVNAVSVTGATMLTLPALVNAGKARDFLVKVTTSADDLNIRWQGQGSEAPNGADELQFVTEDGDFPVVGEAGTYLFSFTEVEPHTFAVSMKPIVAAPQAQGGS